LSSSFLAKRPCFPPRPRPVRPASSPLGLGRQGHLSRVFVCPLRYKCVSFFRFFLDFFLEFLDQLLLLLEDVLELAQRRLHLLQGELLLLARMLLGHPRVQLGDGAKEKFFL